MEKNRNNTSGTLGQRYDLWRDQVRDVCGETLHVSIDKDAFLDGTILTSRFGSFRVSLISADPHSVFLSSKGITPSDGHIYVTVPLTGRVELSQDGEHATVEPGDVVTFDSSRSYALEMPESFQMVALRFPHGLIGLNPGVTTKLTALPWSSSTGVGALVSQTLGTLGMRLGDWDDAMAEPLGAAIGGLIKTMFVDRLRGDDGDPGVARQMLLLRVQSYAQERLGDLSLSPAQLARRHNISLRYLQLLFALQGTSPARWIRCERLAGILTDLDNPLNDHLTVAAIGQRWGLPEASQVSRLFRQRYGTTPSDYRKLRQQGVQIAAE